MEKSTPILRQTLIRVASGLEPADFVIKNVSFLDVFQGGWRVGDVAVVDHWIAGIREEYEGQHFIDGSGLFLVPGFIDAHVHIESSMLTPSRFQEVVLPLGTTTAIWDPHEIANVHGLLGIDWALAASRELLLDIFVMVPSCVPATNPELGFETSGAILRAEDLKKYKGMPGVLGLAEMMNYPGLLGSEADVMAKLEIYQDMKKDGHCPGLTGKALNAYAAAGIHSCHESTTLQEAREKLMKGLHVLVREGSCAKDADELLPILNEYSSVCAGLCSDDRNPLDIEMEGHINFIIEKALHKGIAPEVVFRAASYGAAKTYGLNHLGAIAPGYLADFCLVKPRSQFWQNGFEIESVWKKGIKIEADILRNVPSLPFPKTKRPRNLNLGEVRLSDFRVKAPDEKLETIPCRVIGVRAGQILTNHLKAELEVINGEIQADRAKDILPIAVLERHHGSGAKSLGFVQGFGLKHGAIASSINHDSHNVIVVASHLEFMVEAVNQLLAIDGGIVVVTGDKKETLSLPIGGLMTDIRPEAVAASLKKLKALAKEAGCILDEPFLQLAFLALPVIPSLKITDQGLVDVQEFRKVPVWVSAQTGSAP